MKNNYSKYYTPQAVSAALIKLIPLMNNCSVIDICCGSGNLLRSAKNENNTLNCFGVDIGAISNQDNYIKADGREYAIAHAGEYHYALANPPFGRSNSSDYAKRLFKGKYSSINSKRLEIEMLVANLIAIKEGGILLIILPSTVVVGTSAKKIRQTLAKSHSILAIVDLPSNAFSPERIKCSAIIIKKQLNDTLPTVVYQMTPSFDINIVGNINRDRMLEGNWCGRDTNSTPDFVILQGRVSSHDFCSDENTSHIDVLHTSKRSEAWFPTVRYAKLLQNKQYVIAEDGDIIISRVGASAGQKCVYHGQPKHISDCLLLIKAPTTELTTQILRLNLTNLVMGLSTPYITAQKIYQLYNDTYNV